jgi:transcriptional regulator with XRE-family HTH domain
METDFLQEQLASLGARLRILRRERGWTLDDMAEHCGFSKGYLSRLESGDRQASITAILTLSRVFGVSLASMFDEADAEQVVIVRRGGTAAYDAGGLTCWPLSARNLPFGLQPMRVLVSPNREGDERQCHDGEEWIYVISGELTLSVGNQAHDLEAGDAAHFDARLPHRLVARSGLEAEVLLVAAQGRNRAPPRPAHRAFPLSQ